MKPQIVSPRFSLALLFIAACALLVALAPNASALTGRRNPCAGTATQRLNAALPSGVTLDTATVKQLEAAQKIVFSCPRLSAATVGAIIQRLIAAPAVTPVGGEADPAIVGRLVAQAIDTLNSNDLADAVSIAAAQAAPNATAEIDAARTAAGLPVLPAPVVGNANIIAQPFEGNPPDSNNKAMSGDTVTICRNGQTVKVPAEMANQFLLDGATMGPCDMTPTKNR